MVAITFLRAILPNLLIPLLTYIFQEMLAYFMFAAYFVVQTIKPVSNGLSYMSRNFERKTTSMLHLPLKQSSLLQNYHNCKNLTLTSRLFLLDI